MLQVRTLGDFVLTWNGTKIGGGSKAGDSQFTRLMQMILHNREKGTDRMQMQNLLFDDSNAEDIHHLLRSVIYNTRKKLRQAGLPDANYIEFKNGRYFWTDEIEAFEDAAYFDYLCSEAAREPEPDKRCSKMLDAAYYYRGEFLPQQTRLSWVANESQNYTQMFAACVNGAAAYLKAHSRYPELEKLGLHAAKVCPLSEWEAITLDALAAQGRAREAHQLYEKTVEAYQKEIGVATSYDFITRIENIMSTVDRQNSLLEEILKQMGEDEARGGCFCSFPEFRGIYRMMQRTFSRSGRSAFVMLCTVTEAGKSAGTGEIDTDRLSDRIKTVICSSVKRGDAVCRFGKGQYLLLLPNRNMESCAAVRDHINSNLKAAKLDVAMDYQLKPLKLLGEEE